MQIQPLILTALIHISIFHFTTLQLPHTIYSLFVHYDCNAVKRMCASRHYISLFHCLAVCLLGCCCIYCHFSPVPTTKPTSRNFAYTNTLHKVTNKLVWTHFYIHTYMFTTYFCDANRTNKPSAKPSTFITSNRSWQTHEQCHTYFGW